MRIFKYPLLVTGRQDVEMPQGARILSVQVQRKVPVMWALVDPGKPADQKREIRMRGTGHDSTEDGSEFLDTIQLEAGLVFHDFGRKA